MFAYEVRGGGESKSSEESKEASEEREGYTNKHCECDVDIPWNEAEIPRRLEP